VRDWELGLAFILAGNGRDQSTIGPSPFASRWLAQLFLWYRAECQRQSVSCRSAARASAHFRRGYDMRINGDDPSPVPGLPRRVRRYGRGAELLRVAWALRIAKVLPRLSDTAARAASDGWCDAGFAQRARMVQETSRLSGASFRVAGRNLNSVRFQPVGDGPTLTPGSALGSGAFGGLYS
jgi:hypothetical protein